MKFFLPYSLCQSQSTVAEHEPIGKWGGEDQKCVNGKGSGLTQ